MAFCWWYKTSGEVYKQTREQHPETAEPLIVWAIAANNPTFPPLFQAFESLCDVIYKIVNNSLWVIRKIMIANTELSLVSAKITRRFTPGPLCAAEFEKESRRERRNLISCAILFRALVAKIQRYSLFSSIHLKQNGWWLFCVETKQQSPAWKHIGGIRVQ